MEKVSTQKKIAKILKEGRERAGLGLRELARRARVSPNIICDLEAGRGKLGPVTLLKLSKTLQLPDQEHESLVEAAKQNSARMQTSESLTSLVTVYPQAIGDIVEAAARGMAEREAKKTRTGQRSGRGAIGGKDVEAFLTREENSARLAHLWSAVAALGTETSLTEKDLAAYLSGTLDPGRSEEMNRQLAEAAGRIRNLQQRIGASAETVKQPSREKRSLRTRSVKGETRKEDFVGQSDQNDNLFSGV